MPWTEPTLLPRNPPLSSPIRTLWRMQGPTRVIRAALRSHPAGAELVVCFEPEDDDVLETRFERQDIAALERRADELRELLVAKG